MRYLFFTGRRVGGKTLLMQRWQDIIDQSDKWTIPASYIVDDGTFAAQEMNANAYPFSFSPAYERYCQALEEAHAKGTTVYTLDEFESKEN